MAAISWISAIPLSCATPTRPWTGWSLPFPGQTEEDLVFSVVNALLLRIHQSGALDKLSQGQTRLLKEAVELYKSYREELPREMPCPCGLSEDGKTLWARLPEAPSARLYRPK